MKPQLTIRDLLWATVVVAVALSGTNNVQYTLGWYAAKWDDFRIVREWQKKYELHGSAPAEPGH